MYFSRQTSKEEQRYHSYELEKLAVVASLKQFRVYLLGLNFKIVTDCNALRSTLTKRDLIPRIGRWWLLTQEFNFTVEYRPGTKMLHVDALSRNPINRDEINCDLDVWTVDLTNEDWILTVQQNDERCKYFHDVLTRTPKGAEERSIHDEFELQDNRVYQKTTDGVRCVRRQLVMIHHDDKAHLALDKTLRSIGRNYWFAGMRRYIKKYISACLRCLYNKQPAGKRPGELHPIAKVAAPMDTRHIDHPGPIVRSKR